MNKKGYAILIGTTFALLTGIALRCRTELFPMVPLYISLAVFFLQSKVSRYAYLVGGLNSLLYAAIFFYQKLYASALSAVLFSFTLQMLTFWNWKKHSCGQAVVFRKLSARQNVMICLLSLAAWAVVYRCLSLSDSEYGILDSLVTVIGVPSAILCALLYMEYTVWSLVSCTAGIALYACMIPRKPIMAAYLVYNFYAFICQVIAFRKVKQVCEEQRKD